MKIAMIGHKRIPSREGGVEIVVEKLAERMVAQGHEVYAYNRKGHHVSGKENDVKAVKEYKGFTLLQFLHSRRKASMLSYIPYWRPYMRCFSTMMSFIITHQDHALCCGCPGYSAYIQLLRFMDWTVRDPSGEDLLPDTCSLGKEWLPNMLMN